MAVRPTRDGRRWSRNRSPIEARARSTVTGVVLLQMLANGLGALVVILYFQFLFPVAAEEELSSANLNFVVFGSYLLAMVALALPINALTLRRAVIWIREDKAPTDRQRRILFSLPLLETLTAFASWIGAAVLFGVFNRDVQRISVGILLAGVVTCTFLYLLLVAHFRPVFALALEGADVPADRRDVMPRLMLSWLLGSAVPLIAVGLSPLIAPAPIDGHRLLWITTVSTIAGGTVMLIAVGSISRPLNRVRDALREIERDNLDVHLPIDDLGELGRLSQGVNDLVAGIREREELRETFSRQVGQADLVELSLAARGPAGQGESRHVTVLFVDLRGYTRYAELHSPQEVVAMLNRFFRIVVAVTNREGGWVNKFEGDAALCLFGAPQDQPDHAERALRAAASMPREIDETAEVLPAGIGVATGEVLAGFVGTSERFEYTVIGDVVNLASRLCDEAKSVRTGVLASAVTVEAADRPEGWQSAGRVSIRGRRERAEVYSLSSPGRRSRRYASSRSSRADRSAP